jgi:hypothetical protein
VKACGALLLIKAAVVLLLIPPVLHLTWMLNRFTPLQGGRYVTAYAYLLVFCFALLLLLCRTRKAVIGLVGGTYQRCCPLKMPALSTFFQLTAFCFSWSTS